MIEILSYQFMQYALIAAILSGISCSLLSSIIVLRKMEFIGDGAAHTAFGGIALAILLGWSINLLSIITAIIFSNAIYFISRKQKLHENSIIGMMLSLSMALGIIFISIKPGYTPEIESFLFGDILMVNLQDIIILSLITTIIIIFIFLYNKEIKYFTFNKSIAKIYGVPVNAINYALLVIISIVVVTSVKIVGVVLVTALLVTPGAASKLWAKTLNQMIIISTIIGFSGSFLGIIISYYADIPSGASIVVTLFMLFLLSYILKGTKEIFSSRKKTVGQ